MRKIIFLLSAFVCMALSGQELSVPYYQPFEAAFSGSFEADWNNDNQYIVDPTDPRLGVTAFDTFYANSLFLKVKENDTAAMNNPNGRSRAETNLLNGRIKIKKNDVRFYSWDFHMPSTEFPDDSNDPPGTENDPGFYIIQQWHTVDYEPEDVFCDGGARPTIALSYKNEPSSFGNKRDLRILYGTRYGATGSCAGGSDECPANPYSVGYKSYDIVDAIEKDQWVHMVMEVKWHYDPNQAYIRLWINDMPVVDDSVTTYYDCTGTSNTLEVFSGPGVTPNPITLDGAELLYPLEGDYSTTPPTNDEFIQMTPKIGHYRRNYITTNKYYIDNYRITSEYPPSPFRTSLIKEDCNFTPKKTEDYLLGAYDVSPATTFKFHITEGSNEYWFNNTVPEPEMDLLNMPWAKEDKTYNIEVRAVNSTNGGTGFSYGKMCTVTTPKITQLAEQYCTPLGVLGSPVIACDPILDTYNYKFRFQNGKLTYYYNSPTPTVDLSTLSWFQYNTTYSVQIRAQTNGNTGGYSYGSACSFSVFSIFNAPIVYPVPSNDEIGVIYEGEVIKLELYDHNGIRVKQSSAPNMSIRNLKEQIYFLKIFTKEGIYMKRVVKQ